MNRYDKMLLIAKIRATTKMIEDIAIDSIDLIGMDESADPIDVIEHALEFLRNMSEDER